MNYKTVRPALYLLLFLTFFQFIAGVTFVKSTPIYQILNSYTILLIYLAVFVTYKFHITKFHKRIVIPFATIIVLIMSALAKEVSNPSFLPSFIKTFQFYYGMTIVVFSLYLYLHKAKYTVENYGYIYKLFVKFVLILTLSVTYLEFMYHTVFQFPVEYLGYIGNIQNEYNLNVWYIMRVFGVASYSQVNGALLAILTFLYYMEVGRVDKFILMGFVATFLTLTGTGVFSLILLTPLMFKRLFLMGFFTLIMAFLFILNISYLIEIFPDVHILYRISAEQFTLYFEIFMNFFTLNFNEFTTYNWVFGREFFSEYYGESPSHDWSYFGIITEFGLVGLFSYLIIYSVVLYGAIYKGIKKTKKIYFVLVVLVINSHYPVLNFYIFQFLLGVLFVLNLHIDRAQVKYAYTKRLNYDCI
jgi:hypothetical protein